MLVLIHYVRQNTSLGHEINVKGHVLRKNKIKAKLRRRQNIASSVAVIF